VSGKIRMFLSVRGAVSTGRRERSDHPTVEDAKTAFAQHPNRRDLEAINLRGRGRDLDRRGSGVRGRELASLAPLTSTHA
jgi:hypothetical protein